MVLRIGNVSLPLAGALALLVALALVLLAGPAADSAQASACKRFGDVEARKLSNGEARDAIRCLINNERQRRGLPGLDRSKKLQKAAQRHNKRMDGTGCFSHQCPGESGLESRLRSVGYLDGGLSRWAYGENIAWGMAGHGTPDAIVEMWMNSSGHRANILSPLFREVGVGFSTGTPSDKRAPAGIYTTTFGLAQG